MIWEGRLEMNKQAIIIGIAGGSASGKTTIARSVYDAFKGNHKVYIVKQDDYYNDQSHLPMSFDTDLLVKHLKKLKNRETIKKPVYDYTLHTRSDRTEEISNRDVIILEGIFVLAEEKVRDQCNILVYVDTASDIRFIRRLRRDIEERGHSLDSVCNQYLSTVRPMHEQFIEPSKKYAHVIIPNGGENMVAIDLLITKIKSIIDES